MSKSFTALLGTGLLAIGIFGIWLGVQLAQGAAGTIKAVVAYIPVLLGTIFIAIGGTFIFIAVYRENKLKMK